MVFLPETQVHQISAGSPAMYDDSAILPCSDRHFTHMCYEMCLCWCVIKRKDTLKKCDTVLLPFTELARLCQILVDFEEILGTLEC